MKNLIFIFTLAFLSSCEQGNTNQNSNENQKVSVNGYNVKVIEGCEYIEYEIGIPYTRNYSYSITHKGNCKSCTKRLWEIQEAIFKSSNNK